MMEWSLLPVCGKGNRRSVSGDGQLLDLSLFARRCVWGRWLDQIGRKKPNIWPSCQEIEDIAGLKQKHFRDVAERT